MSGTGEKLVCLGEISGVYGLDGWVKVFSHTEPRSQVFRYPVWQVGSEKHVEPMTLIAGRPQGKTLVGQLQGIGTPEQARTLVGKLILVPRSELPSLPAGEFYWTDLEGLAVKNMDGSEFGRVARVFATGANDVLVVNGERERLIPFVLGQYVLEVDLKQGSMLVDWDPEF